jgi:hypothetical protein
MASRARRPGGPASGLDSEHAHSPVRTIKPLRRSRNLRIYALRLKLVALTDCLRLSTSCALLGSPQYDLLAMLLVGAC